MKVLDELIKFFAEEYITFSWARGVVVPKMKEYQRDCMKCDWQNQKPQNRPCWRCYHYTELQDHFVPEPGLWNEDKRRRK